MKNRKELNGLVRGAKILVYAFVLCVMGVIGLMWFFRPADSAAEDRELAEFPELTLQSFLDGSYFQGIDVWYTDTYPIRDALYSGNRLLQSGYGLGEEAPEETDPETDISEENSVNTPDTTPPTIILFQGTEISTPAGTGSVDELGYVAFDNVDGNVTDRVQVSSEEFDSHTLGDYNITYTVSDNTGNQNSVERTVHVVAASEPEIIEPDEKVIYLTFDDGPGYYTEELLDILDKYDVKVTFFVTAQYEDCLDIIGEEYRRGHTVAIHTYHHDFQECYTSDEGYFEDLNKMQAIIKEQTGQETSLVRFPGGSSNTISRNYNTGIMTRLAAELIERGYQYYDWNVSSGDAGNTTDTDQIIRNVTSDVLANEGAPCVVLQHDIHDYSVAAVESIIQWGLENGYTFKPLTINSFPAHHGIGN